MVTRIAAAEPVVQEWRALAALCEERGTPFVEVPADVRQQLREGLVIPPVVLALLEEGYPASPLDLLGYLLFPPLGEIIELAAGGRWNRRWWPLASPHHGWVLTLRADFQDDGAHEVWSVEGDTATRFVPKKQLYPQSADAFAALARMLHFLTEDAIRSNKRGVIFKKESRWIDPNRVDRLAAGWDRRRGPIVLPFLAFLLSERPELAERQV